MNTISPKDEAAREKIFTALDNAFVSANFADPRFRKLIRKFISAMEGDLDSCNWSPDTITENYADKIEQYISSLNTADKPEISEAILSAEDDEDAKPEISEVRKEVKDADDIERTTDL